VQHLMVAGGALSLTAAVFLVLPLIQAISSSVTADTVLQTVDAVNVPPPPPIEEEEPEPEEEPEEEPPELAEQTPLDLSQLELALNPGAMGEGFGGDLAARLDNVEASRADVDSLLSLADLDQKPRAISQPNPALTVDLRRKAPGTVHVIFVVDQSGRVESPIVQKSTDPVFERPALAAIKRWKFEPGMKNGKPVRFKMRVPITFPEG
jgi:protein TonB